MKGTVEKDVRGREMCEGGGGEKVKLREGGGAGRRERWREVEGLR